MDYSLSVLILTQSISFTVVNAANEFPEYGRIPDRCQLRPNLLNRQCCIFPPFFTFDIAKECGAFSSRRFVQPGTNITGLRRTISRDCDHWQCMLSKYRLLDSDNLLNDDKFFLHLNKWIDLNPPFAKTMLNSKVHCKQMFRSSFPLEVCEFFDFQKCLRNYVTVHCPVVVQTHSCLEQKGFFDDCKEYFI